MADAKPVNDPSMDDILASIRKIISEDESRAGEKDQGGGAFGLPPNLSPRAESRGAAAVADGDDVLLLTELVDDEPPARAAPVVSPASLRQAASRVEPSVLRPEPAAKAEPPRAEPMRAAASVAAMPLDAPQPFVPPPSAPAAIVPPASPAAVSASKGPTMSDNPYTRATPGAGDQPLVGGAAVGSAVSAFDRLAKAVEAATPPAASVSPGPVVPAGRTMEDIVKDMLRPMVQDWLDKNLPTLVERMVEREIVRLTRR